MEENPYKSPTNTDASIKQNRAARPIFYPGFLALLGFFMMGAFSNSFDVDARNPWMPHNWAGFAAFATGFLAIVCGGVTCVWRMVGRLSQG